MWVALMRLIHAVPGIGKDTVLALIVFKNRIGQTPGYWSPKGTNLARGIDRTRMLPVNSHPLGREMRIPVATTIS
jgi:hypothetical protein